jgi:hypothetical protein
MYENKKHSSTERKYKINARIRIFEPTALLQKIDGTKMKTMIM